MKRILILGLWVVGCGFPPVFTEDRPDPVQSGRTVVSVPLPAAGGGPVSIDPGFAGGTGGQSGDRCDDGASACDDGQYCDSSTGSCQCTSGLVGPGCTAAASCDTATCDLNQVCREHGFGAGCQCDLGFELVDGVCVDIDECALGLHLCAETARCENTEGAYQCACETGQGDGYFCSAELCEAGDCGAGVCLLTASGHACDCPAETGGEDCQQDCSGPLQLEPALEAAIRQQLNFFGADIMASDLAAESALYAPGQGISDLSGLECWTNLRQIVLPENEVADLSPLAHLAQLAYLDLRCNPVVELEPLANLPRLYALDLEHSTECDGVSPLASLGPLASITSLSVLYIGDRTFPSIEPLARLPHLRELSLRAAQLTDLTPLRAAQALEVLSLNENQITDLSPLSGLRRLRSLAVHDNPIESLVELGSSIPLEKLGLNNGSVSDVRPLASLGTLTHLELRSNQLALAQDLALLDQVYSMDVGENQIESLQPFVEVPTFGWRGTLTIDYNLLMCPERATDAEQLMNRGLSVVGVEACVPGYP